MKYTNLPFELYDASGGVITLRGAYLIADGGYHKWWQLQCPWRESSTLAAIQWTKRMESVRKDIECCFGRLKVLIFFFRL